VLIKNKEGKPEDTKKEGRPKQDHHPRKGRPQGSKNNKKKNKEDDS